ADESGIQVAREERDTALPPERVLAGKHFVLDAVGGAEDAVDLAHLAEALDAGADRKDVVALPGLDEERPRRDQAADVVHLRPVENARHVIVDAVGEAADA